ncbi:transporter substrate-binding domain-containing protein [Reinekea sp. G2M2-21]|uniref:transporter substrate-binding domain-containing protein n=1 Tax=Reinekea sp. G2M2-21 TaxID=2788942 RepID=UPI0018A9F18A|nr:transporter substrate-binding domain-containing protein [Reinekea sp. G2M2-21]
MTRFGIVILLNCMLAFRVDAADVRIVGSEISTSAFYFEGAKAKGEIGDSFQCVLQKADYQYFVDVVPFARAVAMIDQENSDVIFPLVESPARSDWALASDAVAVIEPAFVTKDPMLDDVRKLKGRTVATVQGSVFHEILLSVGASVSPVNRYNQGILMVENERVDAALLPRLMLVQDEQTSFDTLNIVTLPDVRLVFYVSQNAPEKLSILANLNEAIQHCKTVN